MREREKVPKTRSEDQYEPSVEVCAGCSAGLETCVVEVGWGLGSAGVAEACLGVSEGGVPVVVSCETVPRMMRVLSSIVKSMSIRRMRERK